MRPWFPTFRRLTNIEITMPVLFPRRATLAQRQSLLRLIAVAAEENLALAPLLDAWLENEWPLQKRRLRRLANLLSHGTSLADALEQVSGILSDEELLAVRFGVQSGTLAASVREELSDSRAASARRSPWLRQAIGYAAVVSLIGLILVVAIQVKIMPELHQIHEEFSLELAAVTVWTQRFIDAVVNYWWVGALAVVIALALFFSAKPGRFVRQVVVGRWFRSLRDVRSAGVLRKLSVTTRAGRPIAGALSTLARYHFDSITRHQLLLARNEIEQGADVWQGMATAGLLTQPEMRLLHTAERVGNRVWVLEQIALVKNRRTVRRAQRWSRLALPALVLVLGSVVLVQALTVFLPLMQLIHSLV
jgi:type II secretory pathway component PulF